MVKTAFFQTSIANVRSATFLSRVWDCFNWSHVELAPQILTVLPHRTHHLFSPLRTAELANISIHCTRNDSSEQWCPPSCFKEGKKCRSHRNLQHFNNSRRNTEPRAQGPLDSASRSDLLRSTSHPGQSSGCTGFLTMNFFSSLNRI